MLAKFLTIVLPVALPFLVYAIYLKFTRARARAANGAANGAVGTDGTSEAGAAHPGWAKAPWTIIVVAAVVLMVTALLIFRGLTGQDRHSDYVAPRFDAESGRIVPGHMEAPLAAPDEAPRSLRPPAQR